MPKFTKEQLDAINEKDKSIIVSAGAGSGKTTVLKSRVQRIIKEKKDINELIILTFTKNAANEMQDRIRKILLSDPETKDQADLIDSAYITTFDSFASSLVKKYNYLLNIDKNFKIVDPAILSLEIDHIIDGIFDTLYINKDEMFLNLIKDFCLKSDKNIRSAIKKSYLKISSEIEKYEILNNYENNYFSEEYINELFTEYENTIFEYKNEIDLLLERLSEECSLETKNENEQIVADFKGSTTYDELLDTIDFTLKAARKKDAYTDEGKIIKDEITDLKKNLKSKLTVSKNELINRYLSTKNNTLTIINILKELDKLLNQYKQENNVYEFHDIAFKAIELVEKHPNVCDEIKNNTYEIMIDEYQDTNDIQDKFISKIQNNNVYMVGDIKQSIYRFRNANPYIFKKTYDSFKNTDAGLKIDLKENFRSRSEVVKCVNEIFTQIMSDKIGGANYKKDHQMVFGFKKYEEEKKGKYDLEILTYEKNKEYKKEELEAFAIANDINNRILNHEQVVDNINDELISRDITYKDIVILVDKSKNFELLKKVLEYKKIPTIIDKEISIKDSDEIYILKNIISLLIDIKNNDLESKEFIHHFMSVARSYVIHMNDNEIYKTIINNKFKETDIFTKLGKIVDKVDALSNKDLLYEIICEFDMFNKMIEATSISDRILKIEYFINNADSLNELGMNIYDLNEFFNNLITSENLDLKVKENIGNINAVRIMTIHGSKGLEFNYVYIPYLDSDFTRNRNDELIYFSNKQGLIVPFVNGGTGKTIADAVNIHSERIETLSEKIRLFYVAVTRAKEKLILINSYNEKLINKETNIKKATSIKDLLSMIYPVLAKYNKNIDIASLNINKEYNYITNTNYKKLINNSNEKINTTNITIDNTLLTNKRFSKSLSKVIDKNFKDTLDFGTYMHYVFEVCDLKKQNVEKLNIDDQAKEKLKNFFQHEELKNIHDANIYKELEIKFIQENKTLHGYIDLLIEYDSYCDIIDYKLSNIESGEYKNQLSGYKNYIENKLKKPVNIYLYSINKDILKKIN